MYRNAQERGVNGGTNIYEQNNFHLRKNIMDSHLKGSVENNKSSVNWSLTLIINMETQTFISGRTPHNIDNPPHDLAMFKSTLSK